jgi:protoporphyrinogen oxidase
MIRQLSVVPVTIQGLRASDASAASYIKFLRTLYGSVGEFEAAFFDAPLEESLTRPLVDFVLARAGEIRCGARIAEVAADEGGRATGVVTAAGERADGFDAVVVAVPGYLVPALVPEAYRRREPFTRLAMLASASVVTLTLWYAQRVLPDGNVRISNREGVVFDAVTDKAYHWTGWRGGSVVQVLIDAADDLAHASDEDIYGRVLADLRRFFPACRHSVPRKWDLVRHRDIYCAPRPGYWALVPRTHHTPLVNLYLAGDYTDGPYHYGMESAVISGKAVARAIVARAGLAPLPEPVLRVPYLRFVAQGGP